MADEGYKVQFSAQSDDKTLMGNFRADTAEELESLLKDLMESESPVVVGLMKEVLADKIVKPVKKHRRPKDEDEDDEDEDEPDDDEEDEDEEDEKPRRRRTTTKRTTTTRRAAGRRRT